MDVILSRQLTTSFQSLAGERQFETLHASTTVMDLAFDNWKQVGF